MKITDILTEYGVQYRLHGASPHVTKGWCGTICPWCGRGTDNFGLGFNLSTGAATCWKCGNANPAKALSALTGLPVGKCIELLGGMDRPRWVERPTGKYVPPHPLEPLGEVHCRYLYRRGFDPDELVRLWSLQATTIHARLGWRIFIPVHLRGEAVSWTTRAIGEKAKRYVNASPSEEAVPLKRLLFGADYVRHCAVVVEGPFDVFRIGPGAVATLGLQYTGAQAAKLAKVPVRVVAFDNEPTAQVRARQLCAALSSFPGETHHAVLSGKDPCDSPRGEIEELRRRFLT